MTFFQPREPRWRFWTGWGLAAWMGYSGAVHAEQSPEFSKDATEPGAPAPAVSNLAARRLTDKTLGGRQFWADVEYFHDWRIQQHVLTQHYRLLDGDDYRHCSGTGTECRQKLDEIRETRRLPAMSGEAVILVHGIVRSSKSMSKLERHLQSEQAGFHAFNFDYASTQIDLEKSAEYLDGVVRSLEGIEKIHFVAHSMGGLVVRTYLARYGDPRVGRLVMIATPSLGAELADRLHRNGLYRVVFGPAGQQLTGDAAGFIAQLPTPEIPFGVIAGGRGNDRGFNPLIPGDNDGTVSVASTRLAGAADFVLVDRLHTFLISSPETADYALRFLKEGRFRESGAAQPILRERAP